MAWPGELAVELDRAVRAHRDVRDQRAEVGAADSEAGHREHDASDQARALLADQADAHALVVADPLEGATKDRDLEVQAAGGDPGGRRPAETGDADEVGDRLARDDRGDRRDDREERHRAGPALERVEQVLAEPEVPQHPFAGRRNLQRLTRDRQDQEVADQRRQGAVVGEHAPERDRRDQRDHVVGDHRAGQTGRLARVGTAQVFENRLNSLQHGQQGKRRRLRHIMPPRPKGSSSARV